MLQGANWESQGSKKGPTRHQVQGPKLWNTIPGAVKAAETFDSIKINLSNYVALIPDNPAVAGYRCNWSNSLVDYSPARWSDKLYEVTKLVR